MNSRIKIYKIKSESVNLLKNWGTLLMGDLLNEAVRSLSQENCIFEQAVLFSILGEPYVIGLMISEPGKKLIKGPNSKINVKHKEIVQNSLLEEVSSELLYKVSVY